MHSVPNKKISLREAIDLFNRPDSLFLGNRLLLCDTKRFPEFKDMDNIYVEHYSRETLVAAAEKNAQKKADFRLVYLSGDSMKTLQDSYIRGNKQNAFTISWEDSRMLKYPMMASKYMPRLYLVNFQWSKESTLNLRTKLMRSDARALSINQLLETMLLCRLDESQEISFCGIICASNSKCPDGSYITINYKTAKQKFVVAERDPQDGSKTLQVPMIKNFDY